FKSAYAHTGFHLRALHLAADCSTTSPIAQFFSLVEAGECASQKVRFFCALSCVTGKKFPVPHQFTRVAVFQSRTNPFG
ncbi:hypothetical protein ACLVZG_002974, partial [Shigella flexneri]